jgi:hypothetical protein
MSKPKSYQIWGGGKLWFSFPTLDEAKVRVQRMKDVMILDFEIREVWI